ncbi:MAG TPA: C-terminal binding protein [Rectinemataceae bacterium]|nr:C-terminal binding protein [Rectinemataceae bacterium]
MKVVITDNRFGDIEVERDFLEPRGIEVSVAACSSSSDVAAACRDADGVLVNLAPIDAAAIESLARCKVISRYGVGLDNIDAAAAARAGIAVKNVPGYCDREVAEHALGLLLAIARGIPARDRSIRAGAWNVVPPGRRVSGSTLGILGFGGTARALARASLSLGFAKILVWSPHADQAKIDEVFGPARQGAEAAARGMGSPVLASGFAELLASSDWISVHLPLKPETRGMIGAGALASMKRGAGLVNVARGPLVDEEALADALISGRLGGAGLDVFDAEPLPQGSPLRSAPNLVLTDHAAYASEESILELRRSCAQNALEELLR